jgi:hypothetical protein
MTKPNKQQKQVIKRMTHNWAMYEDAQAEAVFVTPESMVLRVHLPVGDVEHQFDFAYGAGDLYRNITVRRFRRCPECGQTVCSTETCARLRTQVRELTSRSAVERPPADGRWIAEKTAYKAKRAGLR